MERSSIAKIIGAVLFLIAAVFWFGHEEVSKGVVDSKWVQTSCDSDGDCSNSYKIQMKDGRVYDMLWGVFQWDHIHTNMSVKFSARGHHVNIAGWRLANPTIFSFTILNSD